MEATVEYLEYITNGAETLAKIVDSLKVFTDVSFKELQRERVSLKDVLNTLKNLLSPQVQAQSGQLLILNQGKLENVFFSSSLLLLILQNLVLNGLKYNTSEIPKVELEVVPQKGAVLFKVADNGIGIDNKFYEKIFHPFKSLEAKSITKSSGLGLAICKNIVEKYGGQIWVESAKEKGSTFYFTIPQ